MYNKWIKDFCFWNDHEHGGTFKDYPCDKTTEGPFHQLTSGKNNTLTTVHANKGIQILY